MNKPRFWVWICLLLIFSFGSLSINAQIDPELRIAFVSNRSGNEEIWIMSQAGEADLRANLSNNPARDWSPAWSSDGANIIFNSDRDGRDTLYVMNADGRDVRPLFAGETFNDYDAQWSPDGTRVVFVSDRSGIGRDIYLVDANGSNLVAVTATGTIKGEPTWSPDSQEIVFWERRTNGKILLFRLNLNNNNIQRLTLDGPTDGAPIWSANNEYIYFDTNRDNGIWALYRVEPNGNNPERVTAENVNSGRAAVSPDGSQVAYVTDRDDSDEIYVLNTALDGLTPRRLTDNNFSDHSPVWQPIVPPIAVEIQPTPEPQPEPETANAPSVPLVGLSVSGVETLPISLDRLRNDYGINAWHQAGWTGAGQRVGVIDTQFGGLAEFDDTVIDVSLPPDILMSDYTLNNNAHGTDVLRVIHDIAPNAALYACRYESSIEELKACRDWMDNNDVRIINHSVGRPILPLDGQHEWAALVDDTFSNNILWVNSAGNFNQGYIDSAYRGGDDNYHQFIFGNDIQMIEVPIIGYSGTILLSWNDDTDFTMNPETVVNRINFDLEIVGRVSGNILNPDTGHEAQNLDPTIASYEVVPLFNVEEPFQIRILNAGLPIDRPIQFALFVEFAPLEFANEVGSLVAPADAEWSLTVGSVNGNNELAAYSSRGNVGDRSTKPDILAPGEIELSDDEIFVGTSAAAPVVAGIAALLLEEDPTLRSDDLRTVLIDRTSSPLVFEAGVLRLNPPERSRSATGIIETPAKTVFPQDDDTFVDLGYQCPGAIATRLEVGIPGYVNYDLGLSIRQNPSLGAASLATLHFGIQFKTISGPECANGLNWWEVELETGATGWLAEGASYYFIAPLNLNRAQLPHDYNTECPNSVTPLVTIGERARMLRGGLFFFRGENRADQLATLGSGTIVQILGGPLCQGPNENILRWYIRVVEGQRTGVEGWLAEGITDERQMESLREQ